MSEIMDLTVIEIKPEQARPCTGLAVLTLTPNEIRRAVNEVPDLTTKKGRDRRFSRSAGITQQDGNRNRGASTSALKRLCALLRRKLSGSLTHVTSCAMRHVLLTEWEAEQERIKAEEAMNALCRSAGHE